MQKQGYRFDVNLYVAHPMNKVRAVASQGLEVVYFTRHDLLSKCAASFVALSSCGAQYGEGGAGGADAR